MGASFAAFGVAFIFLGVIMLFDKGLLAIGNVSKESDESIFLMIIYMS